MKKILIGLSVILSLCLIVFLSACTDNTTKDLFDSIIFQNKTVDYDGKVHSIKVSKIPEGITVEYENNDHIEPGNYEISAIITAEDKKSVTKKATLIIRKLTSIIEAELTQISISKSLGEKFTYTINNYEQIVDIKILENDKEIKYLDLFKKGNYTVILNAKESSHYKKSNEIVINLIVKDSLFDVSFNDLDVKADGTEKKLLLTGSLPIGYSVDYENNSAIESGVYQAVAKIIDPNGYVVETHRATLTIDNPDNIAFNSWVNDYFINQITAKKYLLNQYLLDKSQYEIAETEAIWDTYHSNSTNEKGTDQSVLSRLLREIKSEFNYNSLSFKQQKEYDYLVTTLTNQLLAFSENEYALLDKFISNDGGYVHKLLVTLENYRFNDEDDIIDVISYIRSTTSAFNSYSLYAKDMLEKGYGLSYETIDSMIAYLKDLNTLGSGSEEFYLIKILKSKIEFSKFLDENQIVTYSKMVSDAFENEFFVATRLLEEDLENIEKNIAINKVSKNSYELALAMNLGTDSIDLTEVIGTIDYNLSEAYNEYELAVARLYYNHQIAYENINEALADNKIVDGTLNDMLEYLYDFIASILPSINYPIIQYETILGSIEDKYIDYTYSQVDYNGTETIKINSSVNLTANEKIIALLKEVFPGKLYRYAYEKQNSFSNYMIYNENDIISDAWTKELTQKFYEYAIENTSNLVLKDLLAYLAVKEKIDNLLYARLDLGINYENWDSRDLASFKELYQVEIIDSMINNVKCDYSVYAAQGFLFSYLELIYKNVKNILGKSYDAIDFNNEILNTGLVSYDAIEKCYLSYLDKKCHSFNLDYDFE